MAREERDPLGHLRQGLQWQAEADQRSAEAAVYARLVECDVFSTAKRFQATNPPADAIEKFKALLEKLVEAIRANLGRPPSRWEHEALQALHDFAGIDPPPSPPEAASAESGSAPPPVGRPLAGAKGLTAAQKDMLVAYAKVTWSEPVPGRDVTAPALDAKLGRKLRRPDYREVMEEAFSERKGGRPKNPAEKPGQ